MELKIDNLGKIRNGSIDVRQLTVFVGPNGTNKTWTAYSLYGLASSLSQPGISSISYFVRVQTSDAIKDRIKSVVDDLHSAVMAGGSASETIAQVTREEITKNLQPQDLEFRFGPKELTRLFNLEQDSQLVHESNVRLLLTDAEFADSIFSSLEVTYRQNDRFLEYKLKHNQEELEDFSVRRRLFVRPEAPDQPEALTASIRAAIEVAVKNLAYPLLTEVMVIPTERKALLSLDSRRDFNPGPEDRRGPKFALPIYDFMSMLDYGGTAASKSDGPRAPITELASLLESQIIQGKINYKQEPFSDEKAKQPVVPRSRREGSRGAYNYSVGDGVELGLHSSASIVRALAGLDIYLQVLCNPGGLVVIDEPEMNAHPDAQLMIIELLAMLANRGVRVVLTTHSPYIVDHLSNLMKASKLPVQSAESIAGEFKMGRSDAFISPDNVSAYYFGESGEVESIIDRNNASIDLGSFSDPTEYVMNLYGYMCDIAFPDAPDADNQRSSTKE